jgi:sulfur-carrier protein
MVKFICVVANRSQLRFKNQRLLLRYSRIFSARSVVKFELHLGIQPFESVNMTVSVSIPTILRSYTNDARTVSATGESLAQVIADLEIQFPGIADRLIEDGKLRRFVNIYINDEDVRFTGSLAAAVSEGDAITVLPAVAGG